MSYPNGILPRVAAALRATPFAYGSVLMLARGLPVLTILVASRLLPADAFGSVAVLVTAITVATLVADAGTDNAAGWRASHAETETEKLRVLGALVTTRVTIAAVATAILVGPQLKYLPGSTAAHLGLLSLAVLGNAAASLNGAKRIRLRIEGEGEPRAMVAEKLLVSIVFGALLVLLPSTALWMSWGYLIANAVGPIAVTPWLPAVAARIVWTDVRELAISAAPFVLTTLCSALTWRASTFLLANAGQLDQAGFLTLAYYPIQILTTVPALAAPLLMVKSKGQVLSTRRTAFVGLAAGVALALGTAAVTLAIELSSFSDVVAPDVYRALLALLVGVPFVWVNPILISHLRLASGAWRPTIVPLVSSGAALVLALIFVPGSGAFGAGLVISLAEAIMFVGLALMTRRAQRRSAVGAGVGTTRSEAEVRPLGP